MALRDESPAWYSSGWVTGQTSAHSLQALQAVAST
jgi:hypothetical protein